MIYKIFSFPENPNSEYQYKNNNWYKRKRGSKEKFYVVDKDGQKKLNEYFNVKKLFFNYSVGLKTVVGITLLVTSYYFYNKFKSKK